MKHRFSLPSIALFLVALILGLPAFAVLAYLFSPVGDLWQHLIGTVLDDYLFNTFCLLVGVGTGVLCLGVPLAWLNSMCTFPGRKFFEWALLLPMALPAYIMAYTYTGLLDVFGPVQNLIRDTFDLALGEYFFPPVRSLAGVIVMLILVLYPYVYLLARASFLEQSICVLEVSRSLGLTQKQSLLRIGLPLARPAIIAGASLAMMETLGEFATMQYFGVTTFTTGIYRTWFGFGDHAAAAQMAAFLMLFVLMLLMLEKHGRRHMKFHHTSNKYTSIKSAQLKGRSAFFATLFCSLPLVFGFLIPVLQLLSWSYVEIQYIDIFEFLPLIWQTLALGAMVSFCVTLLGLAFSYQQRLQPSFLHASMLKVLSLGYAIPGLVIAVGVIASFSWFDHGVNEILTKLNFEEPGQIFGGGFGILITALCIRLLATGIQTVQAGLEKIKPNIDAAGRSLGLRSWQILWKLHPGMMKGTVLTASLIAFVETLKELPITFILRPFNFNTRAVRTYELASDERLQEAALPATAILLLALIPVIILSRSISKSRAGNSANEPS